MAGCGWEREGDRKGLLGGGGRNEAVGMRTHKVAGAVLKHARCVHA